MLVSLIVYEPAAFQLSRDGVIKQMGCGAVDHKPDDPRGIRHGVLLRFALRYRGKSEDADERKLGARRRDGADGALPAKRARPCGRAPSVFRHAAAGGKTTPAARLARRATRD